MMMIWAKEPPNRDKLDGGGMGNGMVDDGDGEEIWCPAVETKHSNVTINTWVFGSGLSDVILKTIIQCCFYDRLFITHPKFSIFVANNFRSNASSTETVHFKKLQLAYADGAVLLIYILGKSFGDKIAQINTKV